MKCGVITFHRAINYGGLLQTYALQRAIKEVGADAEIIDYYCPAIEQQYRPQIKDFFCYRNFKRIVSVLLKNGTLKYNNTAFTNFRKKHLKTSPRIYRTQQELSNCEYDVYITGSDQVWSYYCAGFDKAYFLNFVNDSNKKNSFAASFGVGQVPDEHKKTYYDLLSDYNYISVREEEGAKIIKSIIGKDAEVVPDPTLLLSKSEWCELLPEKRTIKAKYILLYMISEDQALIDEALKLSKETGFKVYYINDRLYKAKDVMNLRKITPEQWIDLFLYAEYVFTNSFHGIAFSINFKKKLFVKPLNRNKMVNSRIYNILDRYHLNTDVINDLGRTDEIDCLLQEDRSKGYDALKKILED